MTETTTIRIPVTTKERLLAFRDGDRQSLGDIVDWLSEIVPTNNDNSRARARLSAYLRTHIVRDFGDRDELTPGEQLWSELAALQYQGNPETNAATAVILDHTALAKIASGHRLLAQLIYAQPHYHERRIFVPTQALYTAAVQHAGLQRHIERLKPSILPCNFDMTAALTVGDKVPLNSTPAVAHVVHEALPSVEWPTGRPVITTVPQMYEPFQIKLRPLT